MLTKIRETLVPLAICLILLVAGGVAPALYFSAFIPAETKVVMVTGLNVTEKYEFGENCREVNHWGFGYDKKGNPIDVNLGSEYVCDRKWIAEYKHKNLTDQVLVPSPTRPGLKLLSWRRFQSLTTNEDGMTIHVEPYLWNVDRMGTNLEVTVNLYGGILFFRDGITGFYDRPSNGALMTP